MGNFCYDIRKNVALLFLLEVEGVGFAFDLQPLFHEFLISLPCFVKESTYKGPENINYFLYRTLPKTLYDMLEGEDKGKRKVSVSTKYYHQVY